ncbi:hypothetical protein [Rhodoferax sp. BAB1]|uniref:hypothetical protein n=1 Tax=Rhodoferax sp. BAB1 TaxID=2741720 RepID=UPI0015765BB0|nr:hypothetical protein [Rhodoferax sp. BAB1]QKO22410.1 hypothetical protein HTY51_11180 [Rhodoferax sp. BAB1]
MKPLKFTVGLRPAKSMFRFSTWAGSLVDDLLASAERSKTTKGLFKTVEQAADKSHFRLIGEKHTLFAGVKDVQFSVDYYDSDSTLDIDAEIDRFISLFSVVNAALKIRDVRRIGIVCEYRFPSKTDQPSRELIEKITHFKTDGFPAKFQLQFEQRHPITATTGIPDFRTEDFWNVLETYYDGEVDTDHSAKHEINLMLDVQRYYAPLLEEKIDAAIRAVSEKYKKQLAIFREKAKTVGLENGG